MTAVTNNIYQTGQRVPISGHYEVVGVNLTAVKNKKEKAFRAMEKDEVFPNYEGWEVCWHFVTSECQHVAETTEYKS
jgi:hypothetical protein